MIFGFSLMTITLLPFLWERLLAHQLSEGNNLVFRDLAIIGLVPYIATFLAIYISQLQWDLTFTLVVGILLILFSTFSWGCCMLFKSIMKPWLWVVMTLLGLIQIPVILMWFICSDPSSFNFQF